jgi:hypothetical protein
LVNESVGRQGLFSVPGDGVLARQEDLILLGTIDEQGLLEKLLDVLAKASESGGDGRRFADAVESLVESDETWGGGNEGQPGPAVIAVGPAGTGLVVIVSGTAWAEVTTAHGTSRLVAGQPAMVLRCVIGIPVYSVRGALGTGRGTGDRTDRFSRLDRGTVRAGGLSYHTGLSAPLPAAPAAAPPPAAVPPLAGSEHEDAPPLAGSEPEDAPPLAHDAAAPDWAGSVPAGGTGAAAADPVAEEAARTGERPYLEELPAIQPELAEPSATEPGMASPGMAEPEPAGPGMAEPGMAEPGMAEPGMAEPEPAEPGMAEPGMAAAAVEPAAVPQAGPVRPMTEPVQIPDFGATPAVPPSGAAVPVPEPTSLAEMPPLPAAGIPGEGTGAAAGAPIVLGVYCKNGHFGDPSARSCAVCGASRNRRGPAPQPGPRPPLGALVLDDNSAVELSADYVVGREPALDPSVAAGEARPLCIIDEAVSRIHARVHLDGWRVFLVDLGSANGTRIRPPGKRSDQALEPNIPVPLQSGTRVSVGRQGFRYEYRRGR